jgi:hypothetical protein
VNDHTKPSITLNKSIGAIAAERSGKLRAWSSEDEGPSASDLLKQKLASIRQRLANSSHSGAYLELSLCWYCTNIILIHR